MPASQQFITGSTPMGATVVKGGATFRVWAPDAEHLYVVLNAGATYKPNPADELIQDSSNGHWTGFFPGVVDGTRYRYFVVRKQKSGFKRDPWARELEISGYPNCNCIVRGLDDYPWHDQNFRTPAFNDLIVYQFHFGVFYACDARGKDIRPHRVSKFLDAVDRIEYLADIGVTAVQPLPMVEFQGEWSLGYNSSDLFSPEMDYCVDPTQLAPYLKNVNDLLAKKKCPPLAASQLNGQMSQFKAFVDLCHVYGIAVIIDVVYNHAGGNFDPQSIDYFDLPPSPDKNNSIYFSSSDWAGGRVFAFDKPDVQSFLIGNAKMFLEEYHADGIRYDEVTAIDQNRGWSFCQNLTETIRFVKPEAVQIAEYWGEYRWLGVTRPAQGMGFDIGYADGIRDGVRATIAESAGGSDAVVHLGRLKGALERLYNFPYAWQAYNCTENHDFELDMDGDHRKPRIPKLADWNNPRSWYARSRSRVAAGILMTSPGVPMLFMGQEFLEDKLWSDNPSHQDLFIWWEGLTQDRHMNDFHRFMRDLIWLRRHHPALRSEPVNVFNIDEYNRILAFHRWIPGVGRDVVVIVSLREQTFENGSYDLGFPLPGLWYEVFNSDAYDFFPNPWTQGNVGAVSAGGPPVHGLPRSAGITIPANSVLMFARDRGDE
jgi:1,4-alpha-glucan branching enzyme